MRILILHNYYQYRGGEDTYFESLVKLHGKRGHQVITYIKDSRVLIASLGQGIGTSLGMFCNGSVEKDISSLIKTHKPDVAHFNNINPLITADAYKACKIYGIPTVQTVHNYRMVCPKGTLFRNGKTCEVCVNKKFVYPSILYGCYHDSKLASLIFSSALYYHKNKGSFENINRYIFPSEFTRKYYIDNLGLKKNKTTVIPYFVDDKSKSVNNHRKYFLFAGRLSEEKGILKLLSILSNMPSHKLFVLGDGSLKYKVEKYKKYKNIIIKGFISSERIQRYFGDAICTIIPSLWNEVLPMVMLESFATSTPVIVPKYGAFYKTVIHSKTGLFYEQYNFKDLKEKILWAWDHKDKMREMGENARKEYEKKYTPEKHYQALMEVYEDAIRMNKQKS